MLDNETKRRIDTARDILVGKLPDPKSQIEQITIALVYKFMDDMDKEAIEMGGKPGFFIGDYEKYAWSRIFAPQLGGYDVLALYSDAIARMSQNPQLPQLFRDIFKHAYLPYRDPETLKLFLKTINEFRYDHSERLGDAFEYLLSVMGSQGEAGQFRTPRHIIDFMVQVVNPQKHEKILDPACGTAGFLISSYKHILKENTKKTPGDLLTIDDRKKILANFKGYDISPDMVRLSLVNMYLHGFVEPHIFEYDTLTSEDRWNEYADVILANPPFMSPKGGIKPHKKFSVPSNRSEVLFVDYIAEHLAPMGRGAVIVPEGIIFQSANAYKQLRKLLVENYLYAVVSLPAGIFNPYSGVKTSILFLDRQLAKKIDSILFVKIENDGYGLGSQRREIEMNDLPDAANLIVDYLQAIRSKEIASFKSEEKPCDTVLVNKNRLAENGEYNLTGERYRIKERKEHQKWPMIALIELCDINPESSEPFAVFGDGEFLYVDISSIDSKTGRISYTNKINTNDAPSRARRLIKEKDILLSTVRPNLKAFAMVLDPPQRVIASTGFAVLRAKENILPEYLLLSVLSDHSVNQMIAMMGKGSYPSINQTDIQSIKVPLPPLEIQKSIVSEVEGYQKLINGARAVTANYRPHIVINPDWPIVTLDEIAIKITDGTHITPTYTDSGIPFLRVTDITESNASKKFISEEEHRELIKRCYPQKGDVLYSKNGTIGIAKLIDWDWEFSIFVSLALIKPKKDIIDPKYLTCFLNSDSAYTQAVARSKSGTVTNLHLVDIRTIRIPLPSLSIQQAIVTEIDAEQALVAANSELIARFDKKIQATLARVWGEDEPTQFKD